MKKNKIIYWTATGILGGMMLLTAFGYLTNEEMKAGFVHLGFPSYFRIELATAKIIGALVLLIPFIPKRLKEAAYVGFAITFISAFIAHTSSGDPMSVAIMPLIFTGILVVSFIYSNKSLPVRAVNKIRNRQGLDGFSDEALAELLAFLKELDSGKNGAINPSSSLSKILSEDKELLTKLAQ